VTGARYVSLQHAAEYLGVSVKTVRRMIARGDLPAYRLGPRMIRVDLGAVDAALRPIPTVRTTETGRRQ